MKKITIYSARIEADYNADINGNAYKLGELNVAEYGEEWGGDVAGYVENLMDGDCDLHAGADLNLDMGALTDIDNVHTVWMDGQPVELWFTREEDNTMTREYILTHTPAQIAAEHTAADIRSEFDAYSPFTVDEAADRLFGDTDPAVLADTLPDATFARCEQLLVEWYDECEEDRPCDAEVLELTHMLYAALYLRWSMDEK